MLLCDGRDAPIATNVRIAKDPISRAVGWIGRKQIDAQEALLLPNCNAIHTIGMRRRIDVLFLDAEFRIVAIVCDIPPMRPVIAHRAARHTVELLSGGAETKHCALGDCLRIE